MSATDLHLPTVDIEIRLAALGDLAPEFHFLSPEFHFGIAEFEFGARFTPWAAAPEPGDPEPREKESSPTYRFHRQVSVRVCRVMSATVPHPLLQGPIGTTGPHSAVRI